MASRYSGPAFPLKRQMRNGSPEHLLEIMHRKLTGDLRDEFIKQVEKIRAKERDGFLGPKGVADALRTLRAEFETKITTESWNAGDNWDEWLGRARTRVSDLQGRLIARPELPADTPPHLAMRRELQADRAMREHFKLEPAARRAVVAGAREKLAKGDAGARLFLSDLLNEPGALDAQTAARVEADLMANADPQAFRELEDFLGPMTNGERDPNFGALPVVEYSLKLFRDFMDGECGTNSATEAARALIEKQLKTPGPAIELSDLDARDPSVYRLARDLAQQHGRVLTVSGPEGSGSIGAADNSGSNQDGQ
jgi:hypothetical protein